MAATFVPIPANRIVNLLEMGGFKEIFPTSKYGPIQERVYARDLTDKNGINRFPNVQLRIYTSIDRRDGAVRDYSQDRIMVCAFYKNGDQADAGGRNASQRFLFSAQGVNRCSGVEDHDQAVQAILDRLQVRAREVFKKACSVKACPKCAVKGVREPIKEARSKTRKTNDGKTNPNFGRKYEACLAECGYFQWLEPAKGDLEKKEGPK